jgi:hypothetical protein
MPVVNRLFDFQPGTPILSANIDAELNQLVEAINSRAEKDGSVQDDLNADLLDGFHASEAGGTDTIPVCNGDLQVDLNAEFLGGLSASDFADAAFAAGTRIPFYQAAAPSGWSIISRPSVDRVLGWGTSETGGQTNGTGGSYGASEGPVNGWNTIPNHFGITVDEHTLTVAELPAHTHGACVAVDSPGLNYLAAGTDYAEVSSSASAGSSDGHSHTGSLSALSANWRVPISWIIICEKS